ncbi:MAG: metallophosphoesterase [Solirubrobacteraceae bacterium]
MRGLRRTMAVALLAFAIVATLLVVGCGATNGGGVSVTRRVAVRQTALHQAAVPDRATASYPAIASRPDTASHRATVSQADEPWLLVSDIHFTPFVGADKATIAKLEAAPVSDWAGILAAEGNTPSGYGQDTNDALLSGSLATMQNAAPSPPVVIIAGDLLAHDFEQTYDGLAPHPTQASYDAFVDKTFTYLAERFNAAFPLAQFVLTLGNNDSYCGDYRATPRSAFLAHTAQEWEPLVDRNGRAPDFASSFPKLGSYVARLPGSNLDAIALDDVFWSRKYDNACGSRTEDPGAEQAKWLAATMKHLPASEHALLVTHVPPGIDVYGTLHGSGAPVPLLGSSGQESMLRALRKGRVRALIFGHLHMSTYRLSRDTPMLGVPSISPVNGNNPAFLSATVDPDGTIADYTAYALQLGASTPQWQREYDFRETYGLPAFDGPSLKRLQGLLKDDAALRADYEHYYVSGGKHPISDAEYPAYACGSVALQVTAFATCWHPVYKSGKRNPGSTK